MREARGVWAWNTCTPGRGWRVGDELGGRWEAVSYGVYIVELGDEDVRGSLSLGQFEDCGGGTSIGAYPDVSIGILNR